MNAIQLEDMEAGVIAELLLTKIIGDNKDYNSVVSEIEILETKIEKIKDVSRRWMDIANEKELKIKKQDELINDLNCRVNKLAPLAHKYESNLLDLTELKRDLKNFTGDNDPVKLRKTIKTLRTKNSDLTKSNDSYKKLNRVLKDERDRARESSRQTGMTGIYERGDHHIILMPKAFKIEHTSTGITERMLTLMYFHRDGIGRLMSIDHNNELCISRLPNEEPETIEYFPPDEMRVVCETWLKKVKRQGWAVTEADLMTLGKE